MSRRTPEDLTRRERQIMDIVYRMGEASAAQVREQLPEPPSYSAVRAMLRILAERGHVTYRMAGTRYFYRATRPRQQVGRAALHRVVQTFFSGSVSRAAAALLDASSDKLSREQLDELERLIEQARKQRR